MNNNTKETICLIAMTAWMLGVLFASVYLSVHTDNYHWMWLLLLLLCTEIHVKVDDEKGGEQ